MNPSVVPKMASQTENLLPAFDQAAVEAVIAQLKAMPGAMLPILHGVQDAVGYIPPQVVQLIADELNLSRAEVHGVVTYYHHFRQTPPGRHVVQEKPWQRTPRRPWRATFMRRRQTACLAWSRCTAWANALAARRS